LGEASLVLEPPAFRRIDINRRDWLLFQAAGSATLDRLQRFHKSFDTAANPFRY